MFIPNRSCELSRKTGSRNKYGEHDFGPFVPVPCGVVRLDPSIERSSVRADSSGSRANAEEVHVDAVLLFPPAVSIAADDIVRIDGYRLEVKAVQPRYDIAGTLDHSEVRLKVKESL